MEAAWASQKPASQEEKHQAFANMEHSPQAKLLNLSMYRHHVGNPNLNENQKNGHHVFLEPCYTGTTAAVVAAEAPATTVVDESMRVRH